jgi:hypothetical protein
MDTMIADTFALPMRLGPLHLVIERPQGHRLALRLPRCVVGMEAHRLIALVCG